MTNNDQLSLDVLGRSIKNANVSKVSFTVGWTVSDVDAARNIVNGKRKFSDIVTASGFLTTQVPLTVAAAASIGDAVLTGNNPDGSPSAHHKILIGRMRNQELVVIDRIA